ncbi:two component response regulator [Azospirillum sp. B510]|nr:two component response regulator [Azospirillum sp. B510]
MIDHKLLTAMVVDDSKFTADLVRKILVAYGISEIFLETSGESALGCLASNHIDVIICDIVMNGMSGLQFTKEVRGGCASLFAKKNTPIIMLTAHSEQTLVMASIRVGANGYLVKPIVPQKLVSLIAKTCNSTLPKLAMREMAQR